jgi:hypothetical protein
MRFLPIILVLLLLTGCVLCERSAEVSGTLLDEHTQTPVSGADVFFNTDPKLCSKSDKDGRFKISATRYHTWYSGGTLGGASDPCGPPLYPEIMITHTNFATRQIDWDQSHQTILLQKLSEPFVVRPWLTFDGNGDVLQDGGAARYLEPRRITVQPDRNGALQVIAVPFKEKVYDPHVTVLQGPSKASLDASMPTPSLRWSFWPHVDSTNVNWMQYTSFVYKLEFIR